MRHLVLILFLITGINMCHSQNRAQPPSVSLFEAAKYGYVDAVKRHIQAGSFINDRDQLGATPLHYAAYYNRSNIVNSLIKDGANTNAKDKIGRTPLHYAANSTALISLEILLNKKSDINTLDNSKNSSIIYALHGGFSWSESFFEDEEEDLRFFRKKYLHKNQLEAVKLLLDKKTKLTGNEIFSLLLARNSIDEIELLNLLKLLIQNGSVIDDEKKFIELISDKVIHSRYKLDGTSELISTAAKRRHNKIVSDYQQLLNNANYLAGQQYSTNHLIDLETKAQNDSINKLKKEEKNKSSLIEATGNYESLIRRKYMDATIHPRAISGNPVVKVRLVIARSGQVVSASITSRSGVSSWDRTVQKTLDRVRFFKPFPESMKGSEQTFNLNFNSRSFQ